METKRTFIAIDIEPQRSILNILETLRRDYRLDSIKWVNPEVMHLTLFFLGDTPVDQIGSIKESISKCVSQFKPMRIAIKGMGTFGKPTPRVVWLGVEYPDELRRLKLEVDVALSAFGYVDDKDTFNPHLTLGRIKFLHQADKLKDTIQRNRNLAFQEVEVNRLVFYESILRPQGPEYRELARFQLSQG